MGKAVQLNPGGHRGQGDRGGTEARGNRSSQADGHLSGEGRISFQVTRKQALQDLEIRVAEQNET